MYLIVFGSIVAFPAYGWLLRNAPISKVSTYAYVNPVVAVVLGAVLLHERVDAWMLLGASIVVAAVAIIVTSDSMSRPPSGPEAAANDGEPDLATIDGPGPGPLNRAGTEEQPGQGREHRALRPYRPLRTLRSP